MKKGKKNKIRVDLQFLYFFYRKKKKKRFIKDLQIKTIKPNISSASFLIFFFFFLLF